MSKIMEPLTDDKVQSALGPDARIMKYSQLEDYETITDLLPKVNDYVILLLEEDMNRGHWTALMRTKKGYYYFNSYGKKYDTDLSVIPMCIRKILGQDRKEITRLLDGKTCDWNKTCFQGDKSQVCGRFCILAITMITKMGYSPEEFETFLKKQRGTSGGSYDALVAKWVNI